MKNNRYNNLYQDLPYKIIEVIINDKVRFKITQPKVRLFGFLSNKYYDVDRIIIMNYPRCSVIYFKTLSEVYEFIEENTFKIKYKETEI